MNLTDMADTLADIADFSNEICKALNVKNTERACFFSGRMQQYIGDKCNALKALLEEELQKHDQKKDAEKLSKDAEDLATEEEKKIQLHFADCLRELADIIEQNNQ